MIGSDRFSARFGIAPNEEAPLERIVIAAVRDGYGIVLNAPGSKRPLCILTERQIKQADNEAKAKAKEQGDRNWQARKHQCGRHHVLTDDKVAARVLKRLAEQYNGSPLNVGLEPRVSRLLCVDVDTAAERDGFLRDWSEASGEDQSDRSYTVKSPGKSIISPNGDEEWVHRDGGHFWFELPEGVELPADVGVMKADNGWAAMWGDCQVLVPPSVRAEGPYTLGSQVNEAPQWLIDQITEFAEAKVKRRQTNKSRAERADSEIDRWAALIPWDELLVVDGWVKTGLVDNCSCPIWTAPGLHGSPKSATAHDLGCSEYDVADHGPLHVWTDNPPDFLVNAPKTLTKLQYLAHRDHAGSDAAAVVGLGLTRRDPEFPGVDIPTFDPPTSNGSESEEEPLEEEEDDFEWISASDLDDIPDPEPLVERLLNRDSLARTIGKSGHGKSFFMLDLAGHIICGKPWHSHQVQQGRVAYIAAEGIRGLKKRVRAWEKHHDIELGDQLKILPHPVQAADHEQWRKLVRSLSRLNPVMVVIDTQARTTVGVEESSARDMGIVVERWEQIRRATGACVLVVHHLGHQGDHGRGSTAVLGALDTEISVVKEAKGRFVVTNPKQKDEEEFDPVRLVFKPVDDSVVLVERDQDDAFEIALRINEKSPPRDRLAKLIHTHFQAGRGGTKAEIRQTVVDRDRGRVGKPMSRTAFYNVWSDMEADGALIEGATPARFKLSDSEVDRLGLG